MLIAFLAGTILFFAGLCAFFAFDNTMLKEENCFLLRRSKRAEQKLGAERTARAEAQAIASEAHAGRVQAEQDALSAYSETVELQQRAKRLSTYVMKMMRERSQQQSLQLSAPRRFHINKSPAQKAATRSANLN